MSVCRTQRAFCCIFESQIEGCRHLKTCEMERDLMIMRLADLAIPAPDQFCLGAVPTLHCLCEMKKMHIAVCLRHAASYLLTHVRYQKKCAAYLSYFNSRLLVSENHH